MKLLLVTHSSWSAYNFRLNLIKALQNAGHQVGVISLRDAYTTKLKNQIDFFSGWQMKGGSKNPLRELLSFVDLLAKIHQHKPDIILSYNPKGNIYAGIVARILGRKIICNISGLGHVFIAGGIFSRFVIHLYSFALAKAAQVFFQNDDDRQMFVRKKIVTKAQAYLLPGSGVDLAHFKPVVIENRHTDKFTFLMTARLLWEKGIGEYFAAAQIIKKTHKNCVFQLLGEFVAGKKTSINKQTINDAVNAGIIEYLGSADNVRDYLAQADCVVLPSYREGTPRSLLEAASMAKPIITTDVVGCREVVDDNITGFLCKMQDVEDLADRMRIILALSDEQLMVMGQKGREKMVRQFDEKIVIDSYLAVIASHEVQ